MAVDLPNFLLSLASALAPDGVALGNALFVNEAIEGASTADSYAVLVIYGGPSPEELVPVPEVSIQCMVTGKNIAAAMRLSQLMYESLYEDGDGTWPGVPHNSWMIQALKKVGAIIVDDDDAEEWEVRLIIPGPRPTMVRIDEDHRALFSFNFNVRFDSQIDS